MQTLKKLPLIILIGSLSACGGSDYGLSGVNGAGGTGTVLLQEATVTPPAAPSTPGAAGQPAPDESSTFLASAYQGGLAEIQMSQLALERATSNGVKEFAQNMIDHHTALNNEITQLAQRKAITLPTTPPADLAAQVSSLSALPAEQFDLAYIQQSANMHERDVLAARTQAQQGTDQDVRRLARTALPLLKIHLAASEERATVLNPNVFLALAYRDGLAEVQLSQLAVQRASNAEVRAYAQRMIDEHTQANAQIAALAQQEGATLPDAPSPVQQAKAAELAGFTGADFDEAYMDENVIMHAKSVRLFREQGDDGRDAEVKAFAAANESALTQHLIEALETDSAVQPSFPFLAFQDGEAEIALSQFALRRAGNADVRAFAQQMVTNHTAANAQLEQQARAANRPLPVDVAPEHLLAVAALVDRSGQEFDEAYMELNVRVHERDLAAANAAAQQTADPFASAAAQAAQPMLNEHLAQAQALRDQLGDGESEESQESQQSQ